MGKEANPFAVKGKIEPQYFCDREAETTKLTKSISNGNNIVLISPRRMGKTGLIEHSFDQPELSGYYTFFIDILHTTSLREFTYIFGKEVFDKLLPKGKKMVKTLIQTMKSISGSFGIDPTTGEPSFNLQLGDITTPEYTLEEILKCLENAGHPCLVAIDEFQQITNYSEKNIEAILRTHIQRLGNTSFIFAGSERHIMQEMFLTSARPFYYSAELMELGPIEKGVYVDFIVKNFEENKRKIDQETAEKVYDLFAGHTFYIQKTFNEAFSNTKRGDFCTMETIKEAIETLLETYAPFFKQTLSEILEKQKQLLYAIALDGEAEGITSSTFIKRHSLDSASSVQAATKRLLEKDLLTKEDKTYRLTDRLFTLWIKRLHGKDLF